ncbi:hypothetical protein BGX34_004709 [Mortierella sp. NVP85]|nr:hypothetical protein BGX34_004709 [Mortierella sp. NVP85]
MAFCGPECSQETYPTNNLFVHGSTLGEQHNNVRTRHTPTSGPLEPNTTINQKVVKDADGFDNIEDFWNKHTGSLQYTYRPNLGQDDGMHSGPDDIVIMPLDVTVLRSQELKCQTTTTRVLSEPPAPGNSQDCPAPNDSLSTGNSDALHNPQPEDLVDGDVSSGSQADESDNDDGSSASDSPFDSPQLWVKSTVKNHPFTNGYMPRRRFRSSLDRISSSKSIPDRNMDNNEKTRFNVKESSSESSRRVNTDLSKDLRQSQAPPLERPSRHTREGSKVNNGRHGPQHTQKEQEGHSGSSAKPQLSDMNEDLANEAPNPHEDPPVNHCCTEDRVLRRGVRNASEARREPLLAAQQPTTSRPRPYQTRSVTENAQTIAATTAHQEAHQESSSPASSGVIGGRVPLGELPIHLFTNTVTPIPPNVKGKGKRNRDDSDGDLPEEKRRRNSNGLYTHLDEIDSVGDERTDAHEHNDDEPGRPRYTRSLQQQHEIATGLSKTTATTTCIAEFQDQVQFQDVAEGQYQLHRGLEDNSISSGIIKIPRNGQKPNVNAFMSTVIFHVLKGRVKATVHKYTFTVGPGGSFMVPRGNQYMIENLSQGECTLFFAQSKDAVHEGIKADDFGTYAEAISSFSRSVI